VTPCSFIVATVSEKPAASIFEVGAWGMDLSIWLRIKTGVVSCEYGNEHSYSIKCGEFLE
jgi:hypothetical protein